MNKDQSSALPVAAHTPTPWFIGSSEDGLDDDQSIVSFDVFQDGSKHPRAIAITCRPNANLARANRDFIIRACNSHAALVKALEYIAEHADSFLRTRASENVSMIQGKARAALQLAKE